MIAISNNEAVIACTILCLSTIAIIVLLLTITVKLNARKTEQLAKQISSELFKERVSYFNKSIDKAIDQLHKSSDALDKATKYIDNNYILKPDSLNGIKLSDSTFVPFSKDNITLCSANTVIIEADE